MNRRLLWLYFLGVPILALSAFFILFLLLKGSNNNNNSNNNSGYTTTLPFKNYTTTSKIYTTTKNSNIYSTTEKYPNFNKTTTKNSNIYSTTQSNTKKTIVSSTKTFTTTPCAYGNPVKKCNNEVILSLDASSDTLSYQLFQNQLNGIQNYIINGWYNFTKVSLTWYNEKTYSYSTFGTIESEEEFKYLLQLIHQNKGSNISNLIKELNKINTYNFKNISTIIFVSKIKKSDILNAIDDAPILKNKGSLNFIVLREVPNLSLLDLLKPNNIFKWDLSLSTAPNLEIFINNIRECRDVCPSVPTSTVTTTLVTKILTTTTSLPTIASTTTTFKIVSTTSTTSQNISTTNWIKSTTNSITPIKTSSYETTTLLTTTTTTQFQCVSGKPIKVCDGDIVMALDATEDTLPSVLFSRQLDVVVNYIEPLWNDYKKIALAWYSELPTINFSYGTINNRQEFNNIVYGIRQYPGSKLSKLLASITNLPVQSKMITIFIFISKASDEEIRKSIPFVNLLKKRGNVNFIILGNVIPINGLDPLKPTSVYSWDFTYANAEEIVKFVNSTMSCSTECINETMDYSKTTFSNHSSCLKPLKNEVFRKSFFRKNKCNGGILKKKCPNDILLILDASNDVVSKSGFLKMISAVRDHFINPFYDYSRIALSWYNSHSSTYFPFSTIKRKIDFDHDISLIKQRSGGKLSHHLKNILYKYAYNHDKNISTILFISNISKIDLLSSITYIKILKKFGSVNIVIMGNHINKNDLTLLNGSNIFNWNFTWKSTTSLISFLDNVTQCHIECLKNDKRITVKYDENISTTTIVSPTTSNYCPNGIKNQNCNSDIYFVVDSTNDTMSLDSFNKQISLLQNNISGLIEDYYNISLSWYDHNPHLQFPVSRIHSRQNFIDALLSIHQTTGSRLSKILEELSSMASVNANKISVYVFVSANSTIEFNKSIEYVEIMKRYGNVNFICLGHHVQPSDLAQLSPSHVFGWNFTASIVKALVNFYNTSKTCEIECNYFSTISPTTEFTTSTTIVTDTTTVDSTTVTPSCVNGTPVFVCDGNIIIAVDASNDLLLPEDFETQINAIANNISSDWTNFKKVALSWYNQEIKIKDFDVFSNKKIFDQTLQNITQSNGWSLSELFRLLDLTPIPEVVSTFIFVSEERANEIKESVEFTNRLKNKGSLNFILLGSNVEEKYFKSLNYTNIFSWDIKNKSVLGLVDFFRKSMNCINICENTTISTTIISNIPTEKSTAYPSTIESSTTLRTTTNLVSTTQCSTMNPFTTTISSTLSTATDNLSTITSTMNSPMLATSVIFTTKESLISTNQNLMTTSTLNLITTTPCTKSMVKICENNFIFAIDSSNDLLTLDDFSKQIKLIKENLAPSITNFNNVALVNYNDYTFINGFTTIQNLTDFGTKIESIQQRNGWRLSVLFSSISKIPLLNMNPTSTFIFVSQENIAEIKNSAKFSEILEDNGSLNIILLGQNLNTSFFAPLNPSKIFQWDMSNSSISILVEFFKDCQVCKEVCEDISTITSLKETFTTQNKIMTSSSISLLSTTTTNVNTISTTLRSISNVFSTITNIPNVGTETSSTQNRIMTSTSTNLLSTTATNINTISTTLRSISNVFSTITNIPNIGTEAFSTQNRIMTSTSTNLLSTTATNINTITTTLRSISNIFSTMSLKTSMTPFSKCNTSVYFVLDARGEVSDDLFEKQKNIFTQIGQNFDLTANRATLDINYVNNLFNALFPIQPKSMSTLLTTPKEWKCLLSFISENQESYEKYCNKTLLIPFKKSSTSNGPAINEFLQRFQKDISFLMKTRYTTTSNKNSVMILFTLTKTQKEIDDSFECIENIKSKYDNFYFTVVKLSANDTFDYSKIAKHVLDFNYFDLLNFITNGICS